MEKKKITAMKYAFGTLLFVAGLILDFADIGKNPFLGYGSVGTYLIFCGLILFALLIFKSLRKDKSSPDERAMYMASKAGRLTFIFMILFAFAVMVVDGISPIKMQYSLFMSYFICSVTLFYFGSYKLLLKYN